MYIYIYICIHIREYGYNLIKYTIMNGVTIGLSKFPWTQLWFSLINIEA